MANSINLFTRKLAEGFTKSFESKRNISKEVNTQLLNGRFGPGTGENVDFARPIDVVTVRSSNGDITGQNPSDIITGKATGTVQDYITAYVDYDEADEALNMGTLEPLMDNIASRMVVDSELSFCDFALKNTALVAGTVGTAVSTWDHVAEAGSILDATGVPMDGNWKYFTNPYVQRQLASDQRSLGGETGSMSANERAVISSNFAGLKVMTANTLSSYTTGTGADRAGTLSATPTATYLAAKDTMTMSIAVEAFQANLVVAAGETITVTGRYRLNLSTRQPILDETGAQILFSGTVTESVTLGASGEGTLVITGPAIYEATGSYNTVASALTSGDVVTLGGAASTVIQPNLFFHKDAFAIGSVPIKKLYSTDTIATTKDGMQIRISKGSDFLGNSQQVRFDFRPAYACLNPFFAGQGFGRV